jgi:hypothetical protein
MKVNSPYTESVRISLILIQDFDIFSAYTKTTKKDFHGANGNMIFLHTDSGRNYFPYTASYTRHRNEF